MQAKTKQVIVIGGDRARELAARLIEDSTHFTYDPMPVDHHSFAVKEEAYPRVAAIATELQAAGVGITYERRSGLGQITVHNGRIIASTSARHQVGAEISNREITVSGLWRRVSTGASS